MQVFERALRRAGINVAHSQGFNPRPKLTFALALPLGIESLDEVVDVETNESLSSEEFLSRLADQMPDGLTPLSCVLVEAKAKLLVSQSQYQVELSPDAKSIVSDGLERLEQAEQPEILRERKRHIRKIPIKDFVREPIIDGNKLSFALINTDEGSMKPAEFLEWLGLDSCEAKIVKTATILEEGE